MNQKAQERERTTLVGASRVVEVVVPVVVLIAVAVGSSRTPTDGRRSHSRSGSRL